MFYYIYITRAIEDDNSGLAQARQTVSHIIPVRRKNLPVLVAHINALTFIPIIYMYAPCMAQQIKQP